MTCLLHTVCYHHFSECCKAASFFFSCSFWHTTTFLEKKRPLKKKKKLALEEPKIMTLNFFHFSSTVCALRVFSFSINNFITEMNETTELGKKRLCTFSPSLNYAHNCQREVGPRTRGMAFSMRLLMRSLEVTWCPQATCW